MQADEAAYMNAFSTLIAGSFSTPLLTVLPSLQSNCANKGVSIAQPATSVTLSGATVSSSAAQTACGFDKICIVPSGIQIFSKLCYELKVYFTLTTLFVHRHYIDHE